MFGVPFDRIDSKIMRKSTCLPLRLTLFYFVINALTYNNVLSSFNIHLKVVYCVLCAITPFGVPTFWMWMRTIVCTFAKCVDNIILFGLKYCWMPPLISLLSKGLTISLSLSLSLNDTVLFGLQSAMVNTCALCNVKQHYRLEFHRQLQVLGKYELWLTDCLLAKVPMDLFSSRVFT